MKGPGDHILVDAICPDTAFVKIKGQGIFAFQWRCGRRSRRRMENSSPGLLGSGGKEVTHATEVERIQDPDIPLAKYHILIYATFVEFLTCTTWLVTPRSGGYCGVLGAPCVFLCPVLRYEALHIATRLSKTEPQLVVSEHCYVPGRLVGRSSTPTRNLLISQVS
ncbi:hypothetical protein MG293_012945 [Ovis ammon polii]|uniref:Uncharacterized protein n=1 Tax=Ovis ammon polii TaxID=230172 RepID=A0AAD4Y700_OVIAM|nr:hypothetical protein MG293_012945 [Ovis ammon polii]